MSYIRVVNEDEAEGKLFEIYDKIQQTRGRISNVMRVQSLDPKALQAHLDMYMTLVFGKGPLSRLEREMVAVLVSSANGCDYCVTHHKEALHRHAKDDAWCNQLAKDPAKAKMDDRQRAIADYSLGLTKQPGSGRKEAVEALRAAGLGDEEILHVAELTAYYNFVNRMVHGLGVALEGEAERDYHY